jgi:hypothetical protein
MFIYVLLGPSTYVHGIIAVDHHLLPLLPILDEDVSGRCATPESVKLKLVDEFDFELANTKLLLWCLLYYIQIFF